MEGGRTTAQSLCIFYDTAFVNELLLAIYCIFVSILLLNVLILQSGKRPPLLFNVLYGAWGRHEVSRPECIIGLVRFAPIDQELLCFQCILTETATVQMIIRRLLICHVRLNARPLFLIPIPECLLRCRLLRC